MKFSLRHLVWVNLVLLALVAYWGASTVSTAVASRLIPPPDVRIKPPPPPMAAAEKHPEPFYVDKIVTRDILNPDKEQAPVAPPPPPEKELNLKLWGVTLDRADSRCIIEDLATHKSEVYRIGDTVSAVAVVKAIEWEKVILDQAGREKYIELQQAGGPGGPGGAGGARPSTAVAALPPGAPPPPPGATVPGDQNQTAGGASPNPHVQQLSENQYKIDRSEVDSQLDNMAQLFTQIRAVPHFDGGESTGFRLFAIRQNSIFDQIGLRNGDIIEEINGNKISDPSKALALLQELRNVDTLTVKGTRNKTPLDLSYQVR